MKRGEEKPEVEMLPPREYGKTRDKVAAAVGLGSGRSRRRMIEWKAKRRPETSTTRRRTRHIGNVLLCLRHYYITFAVHK